MSTDSTPDFQETTCFTFEWTIRGLKNLFDSTKGEHKSKVTKSPLFGGGRWQILFYANSGLPKDAGLEGNYISLYLACEPTTEEKDAATADSGRWVREGVYKFCFELRNTTKTISYNTKEAQNHSFSWKNANWGWAQFTRRDAIYSQHNVKLQDALLIMCTITSSPYVPPPVPTVPLRSIPKSLVDTMGSLLDDPVYSDVEFIIPRYPNNLRNARTIWASKKMLQRIDYFDAMFSSNFAEGTSSAPVATLLSTCQHTNTKGDTDYFEDSDQEDEDPEDNDSNMDEDDPQSHTEDSFIACLTAINPPKNDDNPMLETSSADDQSIAESVMLIPSTGASQITELVAKDPGPQDTAKIKVVVRDTAYSTYRAVLFYIYTDFIIFSPLSSSFALQDSTSPPLSSTNVSTDALGSSASTRKSGHFVSSAVSRKEWIKEWCQSYHWKPTPCSAKAVYRLADRLGLLDLKDRAAQHIYKQLTVDNIAYEVFSPFSATYDEIRKVLVDFFLAHWQDIRNSESMKTVWKQIRNGRHPGFEEVWPVIVQNLEFKPSTSGNGNGSSSDNSTSML